MDLSKPSPECGAETPQTNGAWVADGGTGTFLDFDGAISYEPFSKRKNHLKTSQDRFQLDSRGIRSTHQTSQWLLRGFEYQVRSEYCRWLQSATVGSQHRPNQRWQKL